MIFELRLDRNLREESNFGYENIKVMSITPTKVIPGDSILEDAGTWYLCNDALCIADGVYFKTSWESLEEEIKSGFYDIV